MTAPERIWVTERPSMTRMGVCHVYALTGSEEYIRADLVADQIRAAFIAGFASSGADASDSAEAYAAAIRANKGDGNV